MTGIVFSFSLKIFRVSLNKAAVFPEFIRIKDKDINLSGYALWYYWLDIMISVTEQILKGELHFICSVTEMLVRVSNAFMSYIFKMHET